MILVAGGVSTENGELRTVEVYNPKTGFSCFLTPLNLTRVFPVASGLKVCGGSRGLGPGGPKDCVEFLFESEGKWKPSNRLIKPREGSSGWDSSQGLVLIGGWNQYDSVDLTNTAEILIEDYSQFIFNITPPRM